MNGFLQSEDSENLDGRDKESDIGDSLVLFNLVNESALPCVSSQFTTEPYDALGSNGSVKKIDTFSITMDTGATVDQPLQLITFGSDPEKCNISLQSASISAVHCVVWSQQNSGPNILVIANHSDQVIQYWGADSLKKRTIGTINSHSHRAVKDLLGLRLGPYLFSVHYCREESRSRMLDRWFRERMWTPVTRDMFNNQLGGLKPEWQRVGIAGEGANGEIVKQMEMHTGLLLAFKQFSIKTAWQHQLAAQEIGLMKALRHHFVVDHILDFKEDNREEPVRCLVMPLYLGSLATALPLSGLPTTEEAMAQIIEGLRFLHTNRVLHRDVKPDNILVNRLRPIHIKIGDLGWATNLQDKMALKNTCGTPGFAAPEIPEKLGVMSSLTQTAAVDVYSLGMTFYCMLCKHPFADDPREFPRLLVDRPTANYADLIQSMTHRDPKEQLPLDKCSEIVGGKLRSWKKCASLDGRQTIPAIATNPVSRPAEPSINKICNLPQAQIPKATYTGPKAIGGPQSRQSRERARVTRICTRNSPKPNIRRYKLRSVAILTDQPSALRQQRLRAACRADRTSPPPPYEAFHGRLGAQRLNLKRDAGTSGPPNALLAGTHNAPGGVQPLNEPRATNPTIKSHRTQTHLPNKETGMKFHEHDDSHLVKPVHQLPHGAIGKTHNTNSHTLRQLRRHPARANMIHRFNAIIQRKDQLFRGVKNLCRGVGIAAEGLVDSVQGACGLPYEIYSLIFKDVQRANVALKFIAPETKALGLTKERRIILGMKSKSFRNLSQGEYEAERRVSYLEAVGKKMPASGGSLKHNEKAS